MSITRDSSESVVAVETADLAIGTHDLVIESYDDNSSVKSALKTDTIQIVVAVEPDAPTSLVQDTASSTHIEFSWTAPSNDGGDSVIDYAIEMDDTEVATGVTATSYT